MTQNQLIKEIKGLAHLNRLSYSDQRLIQLYRLIEQLQEEPTCFSPKISEKTPDRVSESMSFGVAAPKNPIYKRPYQAVDGKVNIICPIQSAIVCNAL